MKKIFLTIIFTLLLGQQLFASTKMNSDKFYRVKKEFHKTITLEKTIPLHVSHSLGNIKIIPSKNNQLTIDAVIEVASKSREKAAEYIKSVSIEVQQRLTHIKISSDFPREKGIRSISINFSISVPEKCPLDLKNSFGDIEIGETQGMKGGMTIENAHGVIFLTQCEGEANLINKFGSVKIMTHKGNLDIESANSKVEASKITGNLIVENTFIEQNLEVSNSCGSVYAEEIGKELNIYSKSGSVAAINIGGNTDLTTSYDGILCQNIGGSLKVVNKSGTVTAEFIKGRADIETSYNAVKAIDVNGPVTVLNRSGSVYLEKINGDVDIESSYNQIELYKIMGSAAINNRSGKINGKDISGDFYGTTSYNGVTLDDVNGTIRVKNKSGKITVSGKPVSLDLSTTYAGIELFDVTCKTITAISRNGGIDADVTLPANGDCRFETSYGDIDLTIPASTSAKISASVPKGNRIRLTRGLTITITQLSQETIEGKIGNGEGKIELLVERSGNINLNGK